MTLSRRRFLKYSALAGVSFAVPRHAWAAGTSITSLPYVISEPGLYELATDTVDIETGAAIFILANDVELDLKGNILRNTNSTANDSVGIMISGGNVTVRNGGLQNFFTGILSAMVGSSRLVEDVTISEIHSAGIFMFGDSAILRNNTIASFKGSSLFGMSDCMGGLGIGIGNSQSVLVVNNSVSITNENDLSGTVALYLADTVEEAIVLGNTFEHADAGVVAVVTSVRARENSTSNLSVPEYDYVGFDIRDLGGNS